MFLSQRYNDFTLVLGVSITLDLLLQITDCGLSAHDQISAAMASARSDLHSKAATSCLEYMTFTWLLRVC